MKDTPLTPKNGGTGQEGQGQKGREEKGRGDPAPTGPSNLCFAPITEQLHSAGDRGAADPWRVYKLWFWAATAYNIAWGTLVGLKPSLMLDWMGMTAAQQAAAGPLPQILGACIGMFVGVYAIGYACVALDPPRFWPFALLGLCGKILGPLGWVLHHALGHLPWSSLWVNVFNDLIWWPAFFGLLLTVRREIRLEKMTL